MAIVTVPSLNIGDEIKVENFNDFITSVNDVSINGINADNIRDEGIDRRNLATKCVQDVRSNAHYLFRNSGERFNVIGNVNLFSIRSTTTNTPIKVGPISSKDNEFIMVHCSFAFTADNPLTRPATHGFGGQEVAFKLQYKDNVSGVVDDIGGTRREFGNYLRMKAQSGNQYHANLRYSCTIVAAFLPASTSTGLHEIEVELLGTDGLPGLSSAGGTCEVHDVTLFARVIKR